MKTMDLRPPFQGLQGLDPSNAFKTIKTPAYVIDESMLEHNGRILQSVMAKSNANILLAQKAFSNYDFYPLLATYLAGSEASGLYEARLGKEMMPEKEVHVFCGAYRDDEIDEVLQYADHIVFNSIHQLKKFGLKAKQQHISVGLRINPQCSTQEGHVIYDPCAIGSRLGVTLDVWQQEMDDETLALLDGLHFHTLCEQNADALKTTLAAVEKQFDFVLKKMKWLNMGGGHHITRVDYDLPTLLECIAYAQSKWHLDVYLEPGEAVALNAGYLITRVLDIVDNNGMKIAILDASAACHMPDVIEMPYTPMIYQADTTKSDEKPHFYRLGGPTCLSGDVIGDYYFEDELKVDDMLILGDMAIYTTCKNNTFNGMPLPSIYRWNKEHQLQLLKSFGYDDFKNRLGR